MTTANITLQTRSLVQSLWDQSGKACVIAAARRCGARLLWSEDFLSSSQDYEGVQVVNPLQ